MTASTMTSPPASHPFEPVSYPLPIREQSPKLQTDAESESTSAGHSSSPEARPVLLGDPIPEEEDETSSEAANEPVTPTDNNHHHPEPQTFPEKMNDTEIHAGAQDTGKPPLILNTAATPPPPSADKEKLSEVEEKSPKTPAPRRPTLTAKDSSIKRAVTGLFRRSNSHATHLGVQSFTKSDANALNSSTNGSEPMLGRSQQKVSTRRLSATASPYTTQSSSPPTPRSPAGIEKTQTHLQVREPTSDDFFQNRKKERSSTGFSLIDKLSRHRITFAPHGKESAQDERRHRTSSVDLESPGADPSRLHNPHALLPPRQVWGMAADTGVGLKSRRMSLNLPDDFTVDVVELYSEYCDQSKLVGRRGKSIGKGATAHVRLMNRKGGSAGEVYAVKEFRGKSSIEKAEDYEQKVKSEYSIAKSVHHPNIVETIRLCTHNGRWNHVMEFCDQGDLFNLVSQKYLAKPDHLVDRLCLFKQLIQGLNYLHSNGIAHRDIKLENLLITKDSKLKITDFGVSEVFCGIHPGLRAAGGQCGKEMGEIRLCAPGMCGSPPYVAPEVVEKKGDYDPRPLDVWGAAVVMLCICANGCLWEEAKMGGSPLYDDLVRGWTKWDTKHAESSDAGITESDYPHVSFFDQHISPPALRRVLLTMLNPDPAKRASIAVVAKNRWLKNVECCQIDSYDDPTTTIDASRSKACSGITKVVHHNHLPPSTHLGHKLVRLPGSTELY